MSYSQHGRRHGPGGSDEIPGNGSYGDPSQPLWMIGATNYIWRSGAQEWVYDASVIGGGYIVQFGTPVDGAWWAFPCRLGPFGSIWEIVPTFRQASSYGKVSIDIASASENGLPGGGGPVGPGYGQYPGDLTWVEFDHQAFDGYAASPLANQTSPLVWFRIGGASGAALTAFSNDPLTGEFQGDGGPGSYFIRFRIDGKHASSSGYDIGLQMAWIRRVYGDTT